MGLCQYEGWLLRSWPMVSLHLKTWYKYLFLLGCVLSRALYNKLLGNYNRKRVTWLTGYNTGKTSNDVQTWNYGCLRGPRHVIKAWRERPRWPLLQQVWPLRRGQCWGHKTYELGTLRRSSHLALLSTLPDPPSSLFTWLPSLYSCWLTHYPSKTVCVKSKELTTEAQTTY